MIIYLIIFLTGFLTGIFSSKKIEREKKIEDKEFDFEKMNDDIFGRM